MHNSDLVHKVPKEGIEFMANICICSAQRRNLFLQSFVDHLSLPRIFNLDL